MPKIYKLQREQIIQTDLRTAWEFISTPLNLDRITPPDLSFEILTDLPDTMYEGLLIEYRVGIPFLGKQNWLTELKHVREKHSFVDEQRVGPYRLWLHYHEITEVEGGIRFLDRVRYILPFDPFGRIAHPILVAPQLKKVFDYRAKITPELLAKAS